MGEALGGESGCSPSRCGEMPGPSYASARASAQQKNSAAEQTRDHFPSSTRSSRKFKKPRAASHIPGPDIMLKVMVIMLSIAILIAWLLYFLFTKVPWMQMVDRYYDREL